MFTFAQTRYSTYNIGIEVRYGLFNDVLYTEHILIQLVSCPHCRGLAKSRCKFNRVRYNFFTSDATLPTEIVEFAGFIRQAVIFLEMHYLWYSPSNYHRRKSDAISRSVYIQIHCDNAHRTCKQPVFGSVFLREYFQMLG